MLSIFYNINITILSSYWQMAITIHVINVYTRQVNTQNKFNTIPSATSKMFKDKILVKQILIINSKS